MTKQDFIDWKRHPVTQQVFSLLEARVAEMTETLVASAGNDPVNDARISGAILAHRDIVNIEYESEEAA